MSLPIILRVFGLSEKRGILDSHHGGLSGSIGLRVLCLILLRSSTTSLVLFPEYFIVSSDIHDGGPLRYGRDRGSWQSQH